LTSVNFERAAFQEHRRKKQEMPKRFMIVLLAALGAVPAFAPPSLAAEPAALIDNERVKVWDTTESIPAMADDFVAIDFAKGTAVYGHAGEAAGSRGVRTVIIDLKNHPEPPLVNNSGYPNAFPRPHVDKLLENDRVVVWHYRWYPNEPTPVHFHDKDVVVTYLEDSALQSTEPNGKVVLNEYKSGDIRFNRGNRTHSELVVRGTASAVLMELK
jgi:hypothetical protein